MRTLLIPLVASCAGLLSCVSSDHPLEVAFAEDTWATLALGTNHTCAVSLNGARTSCFGSAARGTLGDNHAADTTCSANGFQTPCRRAPRQVASDSVFYALTASLLNTCGIANSGAAYCWGSGAAGLFGASKADRAVPEKIVTTHAFRSLSLGNGFACGVSRADVTVCWGENGSGQLASGDVVNAASPREIASGQIFSSVSAGLSHACAVTPLGQVYCWGSNISGELGLGTVDEAAHPTPVRVNLPQSFTSVEAGGTRTCALATTRTVWCWGSVRLLTGPIPPGSSPSLVPFGQSISSISVGISQACGLTPQGAAYCWVDALAPVAVPGGHEFVSISVGDFHTCAIDKGGSLWCWGWNQNGQLGSSMSPEICFGSDDVYPCTSTPVLVKRQ